MFEIYLEGNLFERKYFLEFLNLIYFFIFEECYVFVDEVYSMFRLKVVSDLDSQCIVYSISFFICFLKFNF